MVLEDRLRICANDDFFFEFADVNVDQSSPSLVGDAEHADHILKSRSLEGMQR